MLILFTLVFTNFCSPVNGFVFMLSSLFFCSGSWFIGWSGCIDRCGLIGGNGFIDGCGFVGGGRLICGCWLVGICGLITWCGFGLV